MKKQKRCPLQQHESNVRLQVSNGEGYDPLIKDGAKGFHVETPQSS